MSVASELDRFYDLLAELADNIGGARQLGNCTRAAGWPDQGVYFFLEDGERRSGSRVGPRVIRVGTHGLKQGAGTTLWNRLSQHKGAIKTGGGNHRGSIFRLLVGDAIKRRDGLAHPRSWGLKSDARKAGEALGMSADAVRAAELDLEIAVSEYIRSLSVLWLRVLDPAGPDSDRAVIERHSIALLSAGFPCVTDPASEDWLGNHSGRDRVRVSGLWNNNHVGDGCDPAFLSLLQRYVCRSGGQKDSQ